MSTSQLHQPSRMVKSTSSWDGFRWEYHIEAIVITALSCSKIACLELLQTSEVQASCFLGEDTMLLSSLYYTGSPSFPRVR